MRLILTILKRELKSYFSSPIAYIVLVVFLVLSGVFFFVYLQSFVGSQFDPRFQFFKERLNLNEFVIRPYLGTVSVVLLLMIPIITMRLIAEERKNYTAELLFTSPLRVIHIVLGKFLASLILFLVMMALSAIHIVVLIVYGNPDLGPVLSGYLGLLLLGSSFLSIGLFASSLTENQIIASVISFGVLLVFWIIGASSDAETSVLGYLSIINHFDNFTKGMIELKDVVYYLSFIFFGLFLTEVTLDSERWR
ncbi:MAG TPA: ABC transporter permease [Thermodesulfobacteriota bacterium]|jgi:ABC-2 type transport system permease protein|nr:ABC transporter permease [Thermodesulfobacteriota bacterium]